MSFEIKGLDKFQRRLKDLQRKAEELDGKHNIQLNELFNEIFMKQYTNFTSIDKFFKVSPFKINSQEDFEKIPEKDLDDYVFKSTKFSSWKEMNKKAVEKYVAKKLGL